jgi:hypothetical protein
MSAVEREQAMVAQAQLIASAAAQQNPVDDQLMEALNAG